MDPESRALETLHRRTAQATSLDIEKLSESRWLEILRCKEEFLRNRIDDPRDTVIDREVVESWLRSRRMGVDPYNICTRSDNDKLVTLSAKHQHLIEAVSALINPIKSIMLSQGYLFYLFDRSGLVLLNEGTWTESEQLARQSSRIGVVASEESEGTTAHELCLRLKRPVQLFGPEHYCAAFQNRIASAAPIMGDDDEAVAALVIFSPPLLDIIKAGTREMATLYLTSLAMVPALAMAAETQMKHVQDRITLCAAGQQLQAMNSDLRTAHEEIVRAHKLITASLAFVDEGVVLVDERGKILQVNQEAIRILRVRPEEMASHNINEFLCDGSALIRRVQNRESFVTEQSIKFGPGRARDYVIHAQPILSQFTNALDVMMLKFVSQEKEQHHPASRQEPTATHTFAGILGESRAIKTVVTQAQRYATSMENILILGESGTGKELFAQSIHNAYRPRGPFMAVNCAALPHDLVGSELFGYEGGSFTGADRRGKAGKIELAHGGSLFLDEIGDMSLEHQAILLRTLEDKKVMRVGGSSYKNVDFRLIAATNKDLAEMVRQHTFREDLFYRISVLTLSLPPLRNRLGDVSLLSKTFLENYCCKQGWSVPVLSPEVVKMLEEYTWPGNVRQLQNAIHHAVNTCEGDRILPGDLPHYIIAEISTTTPAAKAGQVSTPANGNLSLKEIEKATIEAALLRSNCIEAAAESVGLSRSTFYRKIKEYKLAREPIAAGGRQA